MKPSPLQTIQKYVPVPCKFEGTNVCVQGVSGVSATYAPRTIIEALKRVA